MVSGPEVTLEDDRTGGAGLTNSPGHTQHRNRHTRRPKFSASGSTVPGYYFIPGQNHVHSYQGRTKITWYAGAPARLTIVRCFSWEWAWAGGNDDQRSRFCSRLALPSDTSRKLQARAKFELREQAVGTSCDMVASFILTTRSLNALDSTISGQTVYSPNRAQAGSTTRNL